jgi:hypothetical protein
VEGDGRIPVGLVLLTQLPSCQVSHSRSWAASPLRSQAFSFLLSGSSTIGCRDAPHLGLYLRPSCAPVGANCSPFGLPWAD